MEGNGSFGVLSDLVIAYEFMMITSVYLNFEDFSNKDIICQFISRKAPSQSQHFFYVSFDKLSTSYLK